LQFIIFLLWFNQLFINHLSIFNQLLLPCKGCLHPFLILLYQHLEISNLLFLNLIWLLHQLTLLNQLQEKLNILIFFDYLVILFCFLQSQTFHLFLLFLIDSLKLVELGIKIAILHYRILKALFLKFKLFS